MAVSKPNFKKAVDFNVVVGNVRDLSKKMFGSFKDVRLWSRARSDEEIRKHRFIQVVKKDGDGLIVNFKLVDGSRVITNSVDESIVSAQNI